MTISPATRLYGVIGDPVSHSLSPLIHNRWLQQAGIDAAYVALHLQSADPAADIRSLARAGFSGLNITLPHKRAALEASEFVSPEAKAIGAANTLKREDAGGWKAHNTDAAGFFEALQAALGADVKGRRVVLVGAGGAARAAAYELTRRGASLAIVNRSKANADTLAKDLAPGAETAELGRLGDMAERADIVVNSASLGHAGASLPALPAGKHRPFLDMSYGKAAQGALAQARAAGWTPHDGLRMLVGQAAASFQVWFGLVPDTDAALKACQAVVAARR
jgi:shikimate dehydrogenase